MRKFGSCACAGNAGNVFPATNFKGNRQLAIPACITVRAWRTCRDACRDHSPAVAGKTFPASPAHAQSQFYVYGRRPYNVKMISCHFDAIPCLACVRLKMCIYVIFKTYFYVLNCSTNALYICNVLLRKNVMIMNILTGYIVICYPSYILIVRAFWHA